MVYINSISGFNSLNYEVKVSSSTEKEKKEESKVEEKEIKKTETSGADKNLENIFTKLKFIASQLGISVSDNEYIESIIQKIQLRLNELQEEYQNNSDYNAIKSEFETTVLEYRGLSQGQTSSLSGLDILGKSNKSVLGL